MEQLLSYPPCNLKSPNKHSISFAHRLEYEPQHLIQRFAGNPYLAYGLHSTTYRAVQDGDMELLGFEFFIIAAPLCAGACYNLRMPDICTYLCLPFEAPAEEPRWLGKLLST